jgi:superfamily II DNA or RNA helicase
MGPKKRDGRTKAAKNALFWREKRRSQAMQVEAEQRIEEDTTILERLLDEVAEDERRREDLREKIMEVPSIPLSQLHLVVDEARHLINVDLQVETIRACLQSILRYGNPNSTAEPRKEQISALRRLIFLRGDVFLIARTGFGKSLIFQAYTVLTGKTTIQIIPMSKLGNEQYEGIRRLSGMKPCLITRESKQKNRRLLTEIANGQYTHVLLGPEQACSREFRQALKTPLFRNQIGLIAIDEAHFIRQWGESSFRVEFTAIGELRAMLPQNVVWFACTATASQETQRAILKHSGFHAEGSGQYQTEIIRTSIDRPNIQLCVLPIPRKMQGNKKKGYPVLNFILDEGYDSNGTATPWKIPKTIIFIDGRSRVRNCAESLRQLLLVYTRVDTSYQQYSQNPDERQYCVENIIEEFTGHVAEHDQDIRYKEFLKSDSIIRIMVATNLLGTGMNMPDIDRVVVWGLPLDEILDELWQRIGRAARLQSMNAIAYLFLPYWLFNSQGLEPSVPVRHKEPLHKGRRRGIHIRQPTQQSTSIHQPSQPSSLRVAQSQHEISDTESIVSSQPSMSENEDRRLDEPSIILDPAVHRIPVWTDIEIAHRRSIEAIWIELANSKCFRTPILKELGEHSLGLDVYRIPPTVCCNGDNCSPEISPRITYPPQSTTESAVSRPMRNSRAEFALRLIDEWAVQCAEKIYCTEDSRFSMPPAAGMPDECRWQLAKLYSISSLKTFQLRAEITYDQLSKKVSLLQEWEFKDRFGSTLPQWLYSIHTDVDDAYTEYTTQQKSARKRKHAHQHIPPGPSLSQPASISQETVALEVASSMPVSSYPPVSSITQLTSNTRTHVQSVIGRSELTTTTPSSTPPNMSSSIQHLTQMRQEIEQCSPSTMPVQTARRADSLSTPTSSAIVPKKRGRTPLAVRDSNSRIMTRALKSRRDKS